MVLERWDSRLLGGSLPPEVAEQDQGKCFNLQSEAWTEPPFQEISTRVEQQRWESPGSRAKCVSQSARLYTRMIICRYMMREAVAEKSLTEPRKKWGNAGRPASTSCVPAQPQEGGHHSECRPTLSLKGLSRVWEERVPPGQGRVRRPWVERGTRAPRVCPADCCTPVPGDPGGRRPAAMKAGPQRTPPRCGRRTASMFTRSPSRSRRSHWGSERRPAHNRVPACV